MLGIRNIGNHPLDHGVASNDADVSSIPPIIPYGGFSLSTAGRLAFGTVPSWVMGGLSLLPAFAVRHPVCIRPCWNGS